MDLTVLMSDEVQAIHDLLKPGRRKKVEARSRARALAILEGAVQGVRTQPGAGDLNQILDRIALGRAWDKIFPGVAALRFDSTGNGTPIQLRITKKEGVPIQLVSEEAPDAAVVAVRRVDELGFYTLGLKQIAEKVRLSLPHTLAVIRHLKLQDDTEYFKEFHMGKAVFKRYSIKAVDRVKQELPNLNVETIWRRYRPGGEAH
jgi:hypothetical protein